MSGFTGLRALLRLELREARRHARRTALVVALIAVPVAAMAGGSTLFRITQRTSQEHCAAVMGRAALRAESDAPVSFDELRAELASAGEHARAASLALWSQTVIGGGRKLAVRSIASADAAFDDDGLGAGMLHLVDGRTPRGTGEVALSASLARALDARIGGDVELERGRARVSGVVVDPEALDAPLVLASRGARGDERALVWLVDVPARDLERATSSLRAAGRRVTTRAEAGARDELESAAVFVGGGFALFVAALVVSAAFAVGLRRRQREIGLLGASGASVAALRASILLSNTASAIVGALVGAAAGLALAAALHPFLDGWNQRRNGPFEPSAIEVGAAVALGVLAALAASVLPTLGATRLPIRVALGGRRPVAEGTRAWLVLGLVSIVCGVAAVVVGTRAQGLAASAAMLGGSALSVLGLGAATPWLLGVLARNAAPLPLAWRLAVRDAGRFRARNGPVVTAVLAGMSASVMLAALAGSVAALLGARAPDWRADQLRIEGLEAEGVARELARQPGVLAIAPAPVARARSAPVVARSIAASEARASAPIDVLARGAPRATLDVGGVELLRAFDAEAALTSLREGRIVVLASADVARDLASGAPARSERSPLADGAVASVQVEIVTSLGAPLTRRAADVFHASEAGLATRFVVSEDAARELGLDVGVPDGAAAVPWIARFDARVGTAELERARSIAASRFATTVDTAARGQAPELGLVRIALALCLVAGLVVVLVATALSSVESAADAHVLRTVGAPPHALPRLEAARAAYLAVLGCVLAVPAGLLPAYGLVRFAHVDLELAVPWPELALVVLGLPTLAFASAWSIATWRETARGSLAASS